MSKKADLKVDTKKKKDKKDKKDKKGEQKEMVLMFLNPRMDKNRPADSAVNIQFECLLQDLDLDIANRQFSSFSVQQKWDFILQQEETLSSIPAPEGLVKELKKAVTVESLQKAQQLLKSAPNSWTMRFCQNDGHRIVLNEMKKDGLSEQLKSALIKTIHFLVDSRSGASYMSNCAYGVDVLVHLISPNLPEQFQEILHCLLPYLFTVEGIERVFQSLNFYAIKNNYDGNFSIFFYQLNHAVTRKIAYAFLCLLYQKVSSHLERRIDLDFDLKRSFVVKFLEELPQQGLAELGSQDLLSSVKLDFEDLAELFGEPVVPIKDFYNEIPNLSQLIYSLTLLKRKQFSKFQEVIIFIYHFLNYIRGHSASLRSLAHNATNYALQHDSFKVHIKSQILLTNQIYQFLRQKNHFIADDDLSQLFVEEPANQDFIIELLIKDPPETGEFAGTALSEEDKTRIRKALLSSEKQSCAERLKDILDSINESEKEKESNADKVKQLEKEIESLKQALSAQEELLEKLRNEKGSLQRDLELEISKLRAENASILELYSSQLSEAEKDASAKAGEAKKLFEDTVNKLNEENKAANSELEQLRSELKALREQNQEISSLKQELSQKAGQLEELQDQNAKLKDSVSSEEFESLKQQNGELTTQNELLNLQIRKFNEMSKLVPDDAMSGHEIDLSDLDIAIKELEAKYGADSCQFLKSIRDKLREQSKLQSDRFNELKQVIDTFKIHEESEEGEFTPKFPKIEVPKDVRHWTWTKVDGRRKESWKRIFNREANLDAKTIVQQFSSPKSSPDQLLTDFTLKKYTSALKKTKFHPHEIAKSIKEELFNLQPAYLQRLIILPTSSIDEIGLKGFEGKSDAVDRPTQLAVLLHRISNWRDVTQSLIDHHSFDKEITVIIQNIAKVSWAVQFLQSEKFEKLIRTVIEFGNVVNSGTELGQAIGFSFNDLEKLKTMKSNSKGHAAIHYIASALSDLSFEHEIEKIRPASYVNVSGIQTALKMALLSLAKRKRTPFVVASTRRIHTVLRSADQVEDQIERLTFTFGVRDELLKPGLLLTIVYNFLSDFAKAQRETKTKPVSAPASETSSSLQKNHIDRMLKAISSNPAGTPGALREAVVDDST